MNTRYKCIFVFSQKYNIAVCVMVGVNNRKSTARRLLNL